MTHEDFEKIDSEKSGWESMIQIDLESGYKNHSFKLLYPIRNLELKEDDTHFRSACNQIRAYPEKIRSSACRLARFVPKIRWDL